MKKYNELVDIISKRETLGYKKIETNGSKLFGHVPHIAPDAWFHILYAPLSDKKIKELENKINIKFPPSFIDFLKFTNGISLFSGEIIIYGLRENYNRTGDDIWQPFDIDVPNVEERLKDAKDTYLFIGSYYDDGTKLFIDCIDEKVYRCESDISSNILNVWNNFDEMLISEVKRLEKLFDEKGKLKDVNTPTTPIPNL